MAVIIPILNEAKTLGDTLKALLDQDYPRSLTEIVIVDSGSSDVWRDHLTILEDSGLSYRVLDNPRRVTSAAVNLALRSTDADAVLWISGHCLLSPDYISSAVSCYRQFDNTVVGGPMNVSGSGLVGRLNALLLQSRFGTGMAGWRFHKKSGWTDSVTYALFDRLMLLESGGLDERLVRNQDTELIARLRRAGVRFRLTNAVSTYVAPSTLRGMWRRAWGNGAWCVWGWRFRGCYSWYHFVPMVSLIVGVSLLILSIWFVGARFLLAALVTVYLLLSIVSAGRATWATRSLWALPLLPFMFIAHHVIYGLGSLTAVFRGVPQTVPMISDGSCLHGISKPDCNASSEIG